MRNQCALTNKFEKLWQHDLDCRSIQHHLICNTCQVCNFERNRAFRIHKSTELIYNLTILYLYSSNLNDPVTNRTESCCLDIKNNIGIIQCLIFCINCNFCQIINHISFHSIKDFKRIIFIQCLNIVICNRECLRHTMIGNCNRRMSPVMCSADDICHFGYAIHITHLRMTMKFYTLCRIQILSCNRKISNLLDSGN